MFHYTAKVLKVIDGDTATLLVDVGLSIHSKKRIRFYGINAPETRTKDKEEKIRGLEVKEYVRKKIEGKDVEIRTIKDKRGSFGRYLGTIYYRKGKKRWYNLNKELLRKGLVEEYVI